MSLLPGSRPPRRPVLAALSFAVAAALAACGSSTSTTQSSPTSAPAASPTSPATSPAASGGPVTTPASAATGGIPTVTHGTDLSVEPRVAAGGSTPPANLITRDLVAGKGRVPTATSTVTVQYVGALYTTGSVFDASWTRHAPSSFPLANVVPGFRDAIIGMHVGGRREVVIPPSLGYGASGSPPVIPANSTLVFVIDLLATRG